MLFEKTNTQNKNGSNFPQETQYPVTRIFFWNNYFLDHRSFLWPAISLRFFCAPVNNFSDILFQVSSIDRLEALSCELSLLKV